MAAETLKIAAPDGVLLDIARFRGGAKTPLLCIPGLTRNRRDFEAAASALAASGRDVYALSLRGRGASGYDPDYLNYRPSTYSRDVVETMNRLGLSRAIFLGTSLGGIVTMLTNAAFPERVAAAILNDIGPELAPQGIARIAGYVGAGGGPAADLDQAAAQIRAINEVAFPGRDENFWRDFARNTFRPAPEGGWVLDYDPAIGRALAETGPLDDLWPAFASLKTKPTLVIRGAISDLLTPEIVARMRAAHAGFAFCEVANTGHAPTLAEPAAVAAISRFLASLD